MKQSRRLHSRLVDGNAQMRREYAKNAFKENSYKVGVCFFQVGVQIRRQVSWLNYYSARLFCWIAQRKVDTDASVLMSLSLLSIFGTSCCSCIHIICYNMTSTIWSILFMHYYWNLLSRQGRHYFCSKQTKTPNKSISGIFFFRPLIYEWGSRIIYSLRIVWKNMWVSRRVITLWPNRKACGELL